ncbi:MAG: DNA polymerase [Streptococcus sp.]
MGYFDYSREPKSDIAFVDMKSFYASVECVERGLHPLKTSLCVMSRAENANGLILASSPIFKQVFGKSNVSRSYDLPFDIHSRKFHYYNAKKQGLPTDRAFVDYIESWAKVTFIVPPRMDLYIKKNIQIQHIFQNYASVEDILPYSIDEGFIDLTSSLNYFIPDKTVARKDKLDMISGRDLANSNPDTLKKELGIVGLDLFFHANGIDESNVHKPYKPKSHGLGNSQILPRDYERQADIELILRERAEQVAIRLRRAHKKACQVSISIGFSKLEGKRSLQAQMKIEPANNTRVLISHVIELFRKKYQGGAVRSVSVSYANFVDERLQILSLFDNPDDIDKEERLQAAIDSIRQEFGFTTIQKATALQEASRSLARSKLIGGHSAGGLDGLK